MLITEPVVAPADPATEWAGRAVQDAIVAGLGNLARFDVRAGGLARDDAQALSVARRDGATYVVLGSVTPLNGRHRAALRVLRVSDGATVAGLTGADELFALQDLLIAQAQHTLDRAARGAIQNGPPPPLPPDYLLATTNLPPPPAASRGYAPDWLIPRPAVDRAKSEAQWRRQFDAPLPLLPCVRPYGTGGYYPGPYTAAGWVR